MAIASLKLKITGIEAGRRRRHRDHIGQRQGGAARKFKLLHRTVQNIPRPGNHDANALVATPPQIKRHAQYAIGRRNCFAPAERDIARRQPGAEADSFCWQ